MIKSIIFDMDGVLIDAKEWHYEALNRAIRLFGYSISRYDHIITFDGLPTRQKLEMLTREQGLPRSLHSLINDLKQKYTLELVNANCKPCFEHEYALSHLKKAGYKIALASNSIRQTVELMMQKAHLSHYFDVMLSNQDVKNGKPDPEVYLVAASKLGLKPSECLVVEDNQHGITSAKAAGANVMIVDATKDVTFGNINYNILQIQRTIL